MKPIYKPSGKAAEYGDLAINIYTGCPHRCTYCYAPLQLKRDRETFHSQVSPRKNIVEEVKKQLDKGYVEYSTSVKIDGFNHVEKFRVELTNKLIHLCFTCDPYPCDCDTTVTREIIKLIKDSGNRVQILTKGRGAERDFDLLGAGDWFGVTFTNNTMFTPHKFEPNATPSGERLAILERAKMRGIQTWVSCEPVFEPDAVYSILRNAWYIDLFRIGKLNYVPSDIDWAEFGRECERLANRHNRNIYIKDGLRKKMKEDEDMRFFACICKSVTDDCKNLEESYGEICVRCNKCRKSIEEHKTE